MHGDWELGGSQRGRQLHRDNPAVYPGSYCAYRHYTGICTGKSMMLECIAQLAHSACEPATVQNQTQCLQVTGLLAHEYMTPVRCPNN